MNAPDDPLLISVMALGLKQPQRVYVKKQPAPHNKWTILIGDRIFWLSLLELHKFDNDWPLPYCNWPEIFACAKEAIVLHTRTIAKQRARETREKKKADLSRAAPKQAEHLEAPDDDL